MVFLIFNQAVNGYELNDVEKSTIQDFKKMLMTYEKDLIQNSRIDSIYFYKYSQDYAQFIDLYILLNDTKNLLG